MASFMNVLDLELFTREYMRQYIKESQPNMDISDNSAFDDIFVKPMISILSPIFPLITNTELKSNLKFANYLNDEEIEDIGINNYSTSRKTGFAATTAQTFGFSRVGDKGITIPQGVVITTPEGLAYTTSYSTTYSKEEVKQGYNSSTGTYDVIAYAKASEIGSKYNVGENTISICQTPFNDYLVYTSNKNAVTNGTDQETIEDYVRRIRTYYANQHLGTNPGYVNWLRNLCPEFTNHKTIGYLDEGMERDTIEILARNAKNEIVYNVDGEYRTSQTKKRHIGGCVDIYVRGSEYAVETVNISSGSNIICVDGPVKSESGVPVLSVTNNDSYNNVPVDYKMACIKKVATESPSDVDDNIKWFVTKTIVNFDEAEQSDYGSVSTAGEAETDVTSLTRENIDGYYVLKKGSADSSAVLFYNGDIKGFKINVCAQRDSESGDGYDFSGITIECGSRNSEGELVWSPAEYNEYADLIEYTGYYDITLMSKETLENVELIKVSYVSGAAPSNGMLHSVRLITPTNADSAVEGGLRFKNISSYPSTAVTGNLNFSAVSYTDWESSDPNVITENGAVNRQSESVPVTLTAITTFDTSDGEGMCVKTFNVVVLSNKADAWEKCLPEDAEKMIIFVDEAIESGNIKVQYTQKSLSENEPDQVIANVYKIGFESAEMNGPLSESLLTATFSDNGEAWTQEQYADWGEQLSLAFDKTLLGRAETPSAEEAQDMLDNIKIKRYKLTTNEQLLYDGEVDDNGLLFTHADHEYDSYFIGSSQEIVYAAPVTEANEGEIAVLRLLPNTSVSENGASMQPGILISYSYNSSLNSVQAAMFKNNDRIITNDVLVREANRTPVNIALKIKTRSDSELTSAKKSQIYAAIQTLFDDAGINGRVEQSDIVGKLYTDTNTSTFVEYVRLALEAFYIPDDINKDIEYLNLGDYIESDSRSYLYLNKLLVTKLSDPTDIKTFTIYTVNEIMGATVDVGARIVGTKVKASAQYGENGETTVSGTATVLSINGKPKNTVAELGEYSVNWLFEADDDRYENGYISGTITCE